MKTMRRIDRWADAGPGFNRSAAEAVYKAMTAMDDDAALVYGRLLVAGGVQHDLFAHRAELLAVAEQEITKRADTLTKMYSRQAVAKARNGEDNTGELHMLLQISKAGFDHLSDADRSRNTAQRTRGHDGRFVQEHKRIETSPGRGPQDEGSAARQGVPKSNAGNDSTKLEGADLAHYQQAYRQINDMVAPFQDPDLHALLHLTIARRDGSMAEKQVVVPARTSSDQVMTEIPAAVGPGDRIETAAISVNPTGRAASTAVFDVMAAAGAPRVGGYIADTYTGGVMDAGRVHTYNQDRTKIGDNEPYSGASRAFRRMEQGSAILQDSIGPRAPQSLQYALSVANHVGQYGPEAQKVFGPAADRAAYRYRGTERAPDPELMRAFDQMGQNRRGPALRNAVVNGVKDEEGWNPGQVLRYWHQKLPNPDLNELQRKSGVIPPSEGIIIDRRGKVAHQSVGYADDWYLPFNLKHLGSLKGGEYMRTRTFGGPTTEDVYTGLVSGARSMTVVSHNGVYTVDFDNTLRGGRRFNDKAGRMVGRYGQLLDAVRSKQVSRGGISPSRMNELRAKAKEYEPDQSKPAFQDKLNQLAAEEQREPTLSAQESDAAALEWLDSAAGNVRTPDGRTMTGEEMVTNLINADAKRSYDKAKAEANAMGVQPLYTEQDAREMSARKFQADNTMDRVRAVAAASGQTDQLDRAMQRASEANATRVKALRLNGTGYNDALLALKEQFPYYIADVRYEPWKNAVGINTITDRTMDGARDTGYVAPRHNRPMEAQAGYFNENVTGEGKVAADSIRYQNYGVRRGQLRPLNEKKDGDKSTTGDGNRYTGTGTGRSAGRNDSTTSSDSKDATTKARDADMDLLDELLDQTTFADDAGTIDGRPVAGKNIVTEVNIGGFPVQGLKTLYTKPRHELEAMPADSLHELLMGIMGYMRGATKVLAVNENTVKIAQNKGRPLEMRAIPEDYADMLRQVDEDHAFGGAVYDPERAVPTEQIARHYANNEPSIRALVDAKVLPPSLEDADFETMANKVKAELRETQKNAAARARRGERPAPSDVATHTRASEGLLRATQLHRRWQAMKAAEPKVSVAAEPDVQSVHQTTFVNMGDADEAKEWFRNNLAPPGQS